MALMPRLLHAQLDTCYKAKIDGNWITYRGSVWLAILRADAKWRNATGNNAVGDDSISPPEGQRKARRQEVHRMVPDHVSPAQRMHRDLPRRPRPRAPVPTEDHAARS